MLRTLAIISLGLLLAPDVAAADRIVPPGGESKLKRVVSRGGPLPDGWRLESSEVRSDRVFLRFVREPAAGTCELVVEHPEAAGPKARSAGSVAIDPSGAPGSLVDAVVARLAAVPDVVSWKTLAAQAPPTPARPEPSPAREPEPAPGPGGEGEQALFDLAAQVDHLIHRGDLEHARRAVRAFDASRLRTTAAYGELAILHQVVGDAAPAQQLAKKTLGTASAHLGRLVLEPDLDPATLIDGLDEAVACRMTHVSTWLERLGRKDGAETLLRAIAARHPTCIEAVTGLALALVTERRGAEALAITQPAFEALPDDPQVLMVHSSSLRLVGRLSEAIDIVERLVRGPHRRPGNLGMLLAMYLREGKLGARIQRWKAIAATETDDVVAPFMIGVLLHYGNSFLASNAWLVPLHDKLEGEPRLYVYRSMNEFNLGRPAAARRLLDHAANLPVVDPDVYYCRAEITRDIERELAIADLERYLKLTDGTPHASDAKQARVHEMLDELEQCYVDAKPRCGGPWEHPRQPTWRLGGANAVPLALALIGLLVVAVLTRRLRRDAGAD